MIAQRFKELAPVPTLGRAHWGRVHVEADRRKPLPESIAQPERKRR
jgi:hypothetical protein